MTFGETFRDLTRAALLRRPSLPAGRGLPAAGPDALLRVTFLGNASLLFDDGDTQILTDGFFSRPGAVQTVVGRVHSNPGVVDSCLRRAGVTRLAAVFAMHTHYDHVLDVSTIVRSTGAQLLGSTSTAMVGRGAGVPERQLAVVQPEESYTFGRFTLRAMVTGHVPPPRLAGTINHPLSSPARVTSYRMGPCFSLLVEHDGRRILVQGSAGAPHDSLLSCRADVVYLAVGALSKQSLEYRNQYWDDVVTTIGARRVLPIHWDDFAKPLTKALVPLPYLFDNFTRTLEFLDSRAAESGIDVRIPEVWQSVDPFLDLEQW